MSHGSDNFPDTMTLALTLPVGLLILALCGCTQALQSPVTAAASISPLLRSPDGASSVVPGRYLVIYRNGLVPASPQTAATTMTQSLPALGISIQQSTTPATPATDAANIAAIAAQPNVEFVLRDRFVEGHQMSTTGATGTAPVRPIAADEDTDDAFYHSPQGWPVIQAGGYGSSTAPGPWTTTQGAGVRIAILDSGVDATHPDIAPNLALNLTEVDQTSLPSACDDASPQDQHGHGTWTASLAAGAAGPNTGGVIGVAPQATLLNIKVLERIPAIGLTTASSCAAGQTAGLLSWVLQGIDDAVANKADIISLSLGSIIDLNTGDGAGWKTVFDRATHAATSAGVVVIAAVGNDGLDLSAGRYIELPAQARDVLPIVASTNPACAEDLSANAVCAPGPVTRPFYSNFGATLNAIAAPGGSYPNISETGANGWVRGACSTSGCFTAGPSAYIQAMGTSASAPLVAGAAALLRATHPTWTSTQIVAALRNSATHTSAMTEPQLNTAAALLTQ